MDPIPTGEPADLLRAYLAVHAQGAPVPAALYAKGEALDARLREAPPTSADWGRFLVAQGELAAEHMDDPAAAARWFLRALESVRVHGDAEVGVTAGYDQAVLHERRGDEARAILAYRTAADAAFAAAVVPLAALRAAADAIRLTFASRGSLADTDRVLIKQAWLGWTWLLATAPDQVPADLDRGLGLTLAALLLPEDDPTALAATWRAWPPQRLGTPAGPWRDDEPACLLALYEAAARAADLHLADEGGDPGAPYRALAAAARRALPPA
jgi:hypothetical protein